MTDAEITVPATTAAGAAMVSSALSTHGDIVSGDLQDRGRAECDDSRDSSDPCKAGCEMENIGVSGDAQGE